MHDYTQDELNEDAVIEVLSLMLDHFRIGIMEQLNFDEGDIKAYYRHMNDCKGPTPEQVKYVQDKIEEYRKDHPRLEGVRKD